MRRTVSGAEGRGGGVWNLAASSFRVPAGRRGRGVTHRKSAPASGRLHLAGRVQRPAVHSRHATPDTERKVGLAAETN